MQRAIACALLAGSAAAHAGPSGEQVVAGQATVSRTGNNTLITQTSERTAINWQNFNIGAAESVRFAQPAASSIALNRVLGQNPTEILGSLSASGQVFIVNPNGVLFGKSAQVDVGGLVASTLNLGTEDFMAGRYRFSSDSLTTGNTLGSVTNLGRILANGGYIALIGPSVKNDGQLIANNGSVALAAGEMVTVNLNGNRYLGLTIEQGALNALAQNNGLIKADGGQAILTAKATDQLIKAVVNNEGIVEANSLAEVNGVIRLDGGMVTNTGVLRANGNNNIDGGGIDIRGAFVGLGGSVSADGANGGTFSVQSQGNLSLAEIVSARGLSGRGGTIDYLSGGRLTEIDSSRNDASGATDGGRISANAGGGMLSSGYYTAKGESGLGGRIDLSGLNVRLLSSQIDASGVTQGGRVRVGGAFQGGKTPDAKADYYDSFVGRWGESTPIAESQRTFINDGTRIDVSASNGKGGTAIVWSSKETTMLGGINARGAIMSGTITGGSIEISSAETLRRASLENVHSGDGGPLLLDPKNIVIGDVATVSNWSLQAILGSGYLSSSVAQDVNVALDSLDQFGGSVSLNAAGDRLAVGARNDAGASNTQVNSGAVHLFTFSDTSFSGGMLAATLGSGYSGGKNVNVALANGTGFGSAVSLNAAGDRLAVGASGDNGVGIFKFSAGAVHLFTFSDASFNGGSLAATLGSGYSNGKNINVVLDSSDRFGSSVSLNAVGNRLAVGADEDGGAANVKSLSGAVRLFTFGDTSFGGGALAATLGSGYTNGKDVNVALDSGDGFGRSVSLNAAGNRLAVGAPGDGGLGNVNSASGAVHLFSFSDTNFSGGALSATLGAGYTGGNNVSVALDTGDRFGSAVSLNAAGDRLAAGSPNDGGAGNTKFAAGAVRLFTFSDGSFNGGVHAATLGFGYTGGRNINLGLDSNRSFGTAVSLNALGDRLAVGAIGDNGSDNTNPQSGAVQLFTFNDVNFNGGAQVGTVGSGYANGRNVNVALDNFDQFGSAVSLNAAGDRLAVGALGDASAANSSFGFGAVRLFTFSDNSFSGGTLAATLGSGYIGGKNVNVGLDSGDLFGASVSLNALGNRLAVGAPNDSGAGNGNSLSGAVHLFTFGDNSFGGGVRAAVVGSGYTGGKNVNVSLNNFVRFGSAVSLNAAGDRLAVGAPNDSGAGVTNPDSGTVRLFTFNDASFDGGALAASVGAGYSGAKDVNVALNSGDFFGRALSLNGAGDRLAVGAPGDTGASKALSLAGAVRLFTFADRSFGGGALAATIGSGYAGGKNINVALDNTDTFGEGVSLNSAGDMLAVGAPNDMGATNTSGISGAVRLFNFTDTNFSGGALAATFGVGYVGGKNINLPVVGEKFGHAVSLNAIGDRLAVGASDNRSASGGNFQSGAVYLFSNHIASGPAAAQRYAYDDRAEQSITLKRSDLEAVLAQGAAVSLQASNDITLGSALNISNPAGNGGALTLQAGRSVLLNQSITTDNGNLTLIANDTLANGVIDLQRDVGTAVISMAAGTSINAGTGAVNIELRDGAGKTNRASGAITLGSITAGSVQAVNRGPTAGSNIVINGGATLNASGAGDALVLAAASGGNFVNNAGAGALSAANGNWRVWSANPANDSRGGLVYGFKQYNATFGITAPAQANGNGFFYSLAPVLTPSATGNVSKIYDGSTVATLAAANLTAAGTVDGDSVTLSGSATYNNRNVGANKQVTVNGITASAHNGAAVVYGYTVNPATVTASNGTITPRAITVSATTESRIYDGSTTSIAVPTITTGTLAPLGGDTAVFTQSFDNRNAGSNKALIPAGVINDGNGGNNYSYTFVPNTTGVITPAPITAVTGITANDKVYDATTAATLNTGAAAFTGRIGTDVLTVSAAAGAFSDANAGNGKPVSVSGITLDGADAGNYALTNSTSVASASIIPRIISISANNAGKIYGNADPVLSFNVGGQGLAAGETLTSVINGALVRAPGESVTGSPYAINRGTLTANSNYNIASYAPGRFDISPRPLTVTADDKTTLTGIPLPPFSATYRGLAFNDTPASLNGTLAFATPATALSPPGVYAITPSGQSSANYNISYVDGGLTIVNLGAQPPGVQGALATVESHPEKHRPGSPDDREEKQEVGQVITVQGDGVLLPPGLR